MKSPTLWMMKSAVADEMKSTHRRSDFIPAGDFIVADDFFHPQGWISLKKLRVRDSELFLAAE